MLPRLVIFQYNPETMTRTLKVQRTQHQGDRVEAQRLKEPPVEEIQLKVELDVADQPEKHHAAAVESGICPQLSALVMMLLP